MNITLSFILYFTHCIAKGYALYRDCNIIPVNGWNDTLVHVEVRNCVTIPEKRVNQGIILWPDGKQDI